jgi:hypothetical protein
MKVDETLSKLLFLQISNALILNIIYNMYTRMYHIEKGIAPHTSLTLWRVSLHHAFKKHLKKKNLYKIKILPRLEILVYLSMVKS